MFLWPVCAGDPSLDATAEALVALDEAGADVIELGMPYNDPLADGTTIQEAAHRALTSGTTLDKVIGMLEKTTERVKAPVVLFTYFNVVMARGLEKFCQRIRAAGVSGLLVPDIPLEETSAIREAVNRHDMELVLLVAPTTGADSAGLAPQPAEQCTTANRMTAQALTLLAATDRLCASVRIQRVAGAGKERMQRIVDHTQGFLYLVSVTGVTGERSEVSSKVQQLIPDVRSKTDKAVCVGFGVSTREHALQIQRWGADGVIVGSALVKLLAKGGSGSGGVAEMKGLAADMRSALDGN